MTETPAVDLTRLDTFRFVTEEIVRFQDLDRVGHVNNVAFCVYAESGRVDFAEAVWPGSTAGQGIGWAIVNFNLHFRAQAHYPGRVKVGTAVTRIGTTSLTMSQGLFMADDGSCFATAESALVWLEFKTGKPVPLPQAMKDAVAPYVA